MKSSLPGMRRSVLLFSLATAALSESSHAGMTSYTLSDVARLRVEELSFFLVAFLLCVAGIKAIWNAFVRDFPSIPKLDWKRAFALTTLVSVLMLLVLSMISGARELLTPGAWQRQGTAYKLRTPALDTERRAHLELLRVALFDYAK